MPEPGRAHNGELEVRVPALGTVRIAGRDMLLAGTLIALGAAAVTVQYITLRSFHASIQTDVRRAVDLHSAAAVDRQQMLGLLRLRTCTTEYLEAARTTWPKEAREEVRRLWGEVCMATKGR